MTEKRARENAARSEEDLAVQIDQLREDLAKITETLKGIGVGKAEELSGDLKDRAAHLAAAGRRQAEALSGSVGQIEAEMARSVRDRPLQSLALAALAGLILGLMSRRG